MTVTLNPYTGLPDAPESVPDEVVPELDAFRDLLRSFGMALDDSMNDEKSRQCGLESWTSPRERENDYHAKIYGYLGGLNDSSDRSPQVTVYVGGVQVHTFVKYARSKPLFERAVRTLLEAVK